MVHAGNWLEGLRGGRLPPAALDAGLIVAELGEARLEAWRDIARGHGATPG